MKLLSALAAEFRSRRIPSRPEAPFDFQCNVCGAQNAGVPIAQVSNRECPSCPRCGSSLRMRSIVHLLGRELFGRRLLLPHFPVDKSIRGLGMSDWDGYARPLAEKFDYVNTFYHAEPRFDITAMPEEMAGRYRFVISTDVFEHIPRFALDRAFANARRLLRDDGFLLFTVPFEKTGETREHFPRLHDFRIEEGPRGRVLRNRTAEGVDEAFQDLVFHGGDGSTLEMRVFSEPDLRRRLAAAGFSRVAVGMKNEPRLGIVWPIDHSVPIVARP